MGFLANSTSDPASNCILFYCGQECVAVDENEAAEGVVSVLIKRNVQAKVILEYNMTVDDIILNKIIPKNQIYNLFL